MKKVLITGANSYIGVSFEEYAKEHYSSDLFINTIDMIDSRWREHDFSAYDIVYHVAGIAHADVGKADEATKQKYYAVNTDLAIETCRKAKAEGVKQFVFMSSAIIYGDSAPYGRKKRITAKTLPKPANFYGDSKWKADQGVRELADEQFTVTVLRPPMIYGKDSKGNYPILAKMAKVLPVFPRVKNERSMLYIGNLCEFLCQVMIRGEGGIFWPQNKEYSNTSRMVSMIARANGHRILETGCLTPFVVLASRIPGRIGTLTNKAFGNLAYDRKMSQYDFAYQQVGVEESIQKTEGSGSQKHILLISQYFHPETFRVNDMACEWVKRGYKVTVLTGIPNYPMGQFFEGYDTKHRIREKWNGVNIIRIPLVPRGNSSNKLVNAIGMAANYFSFVRSGRKWVASKEAAKLHADLVFTFEVSPMTQALIGVWYGRRYHVPTFLYVQDLWPENVETVTGIHNRLVIGPIDRMVDYIYRKTDRIFTTSPSFVKAIIGRKVPVDPRKVHYWPQYAEEFYRPMKPRPIYGIDPKDGYYKIAFTGNIGTAQGLEVLPKTAKLLKNEKVTFIIVGDGRYQPEFERKIKQLQVKEKFIMIPRVPAEFVPEILSVCDAGFISFSKTPLWENTIPAKLQSYMACGKAIIASASGETRRVIEEAGCGICTEIGDADALAKGIRQIMKTDHSDLGEKARRYFEKNFDKKMLMDEMEIYLIKCRGRKGSVYSRRAMF